MGKYKKGKIWGKYKKGKLEKYGKFVNRFGVSDSSRFIPLSFIFSVWGMKVAVCF